MVNLFNPFEEKIQITKVSSITGYINAIQNLGDREFVYRGENEDYSTITASAYRRIKTHLGGFSDSYYRFESILNEFYRNYGSPNEAEKVDFIGFAQHHGLPTPLLDVSKSPLVALFFATEQPKGQIQRVNIFRADTAVDLSDFLRGPTAVNIWSSLLVDHNLDIINALQHQLDEIFKSDPLVGYRCWRELIWHIQSPPDEMQYPLIDRTDNEMLKNIKTSPDLRKEDRKDIGEVAFAQKYVKPLGIGWTCHTAKDKTIIEYDVKAYVDTLLEYLRLMYSARDEAAWAFHNLPIGFLIKYEPVHPFDRMKSQQGMFFYQLGMHFTESEYGSGSYEEQIIIPDHVIEIHNADKIFQELQSLGINRYTLFPDADNLARYIKDKEEFHFSKSTRN